MNFSKYLAGGAVVLATSLVSAQTAYAACATDGLPSSMDKPGGYPHARLRN